MNTCISRIAALLIISLAPASAIAQPATPTAVVDDAALTAFSKELEALVKDGNGIEMNKRFDMTAMGEIVTAGIDVPLQFKIGFLAGMKDQSKPETGMGYGIVTAVGQTGSYRFLRCVNEEDGRRVALFRMQGDAGLNYHRYFIRKNADGAMAIEDTYVAMIGERLSQMMRRIYILAAGEANNGQAGAMVAGETEMSKYMSQIQAMTAAHKAGEYEKVLAIYDTELSDKHKRERYPLLMRTMSAAFVGSAKYEQAMKDYLEISKDTLTIDLISIDALLMRGEFDQSLAAVDRVDKAIGGDPYLDVMRGNLHAVKKDFVQAKACVKRALEREPGMFAANDALLGISLIEKNHDDTARMLLEIEKAHGIVFSDLKGASGYEGFVASPQYTEWMTKKKSAAVP